LNEGARLRAALLSERSGGIELLFDKQKEVDVDVPCKGNGNTVRFGLSHDAATRFEKSKPSSCLKEYLFSTVHTPHSTLKRAHHIPDASEDAASLSQYADESKDEAAYDHAYLLPSAVITTAGPLMSASVNVSMATNISSWPWSPSLPSAELRSR
jgi:hypothetical protein